VFGWFLYAAELTGWYIANIYEHEIFFSLCTDTHIMDGNKFILLYYSFPITQNTQSHKTVPSVKTCYIPLPLNISQVKVKVMFALEQATKAEKVSRGIALLFL
jgi:hypothetical protein